MSESHGHEEHQPKSEVEEKMAEFDTAAKHRGNANRWLGEHFHNQMLSKNIEEIMKKFTPEEPSYQHIYDLLNEPSLSSEQSERLGRLIRENETVYSKKRAAIAADKARAGGLAKLAFGGALGALMPGGGGGGHEEHGEKGKHGHAEKGWLDKLDAYLENIEHHNAQYKGILNNVAGLGLDLVRGILGAFMGGGGGRRRTQSSLSFLFSFAPGAFRSRAFFGENFNRHGERDVFRVNLF